MTLDIAELNRLNHAKVSRIIVRQRGPFLATLKPAGFLGGDLFARYRRATEGAGFDPAEKCQTAPVNKVAILLGRLQAEGFALEVEPALAATIQAASREAEQNYEQAARHAKRVDLELRERGLELYPFQKEGIAWLSKRAGAMLSDEMGLGKTIQAIVALPEMAPVLVVCPALVKGTWGRELGKWRPDYRVTVLAGKGSFRWPVPGEVVITNYDVLPETVAEETGEIDRYGKKLKVHFLPKEIQDACPKSLQVIGDEIHLTKNSKAKRTLAWRAITSTAIAGGGRIVGLTGTPMLNETPELWSVLVGLGLAQEAFGSYDGFFTLMGGKKVKYGTEWGTPSPMVGPRLARVTLRRKRAEVLPQLPGKTYRDIDVEVTAKVLKKIPDAPPEWETLDAKSDLPSFTGYSAARMALAEAKIPAMLELVESFEEQGEKLVVFSAHLGPINELARRPGWAIITGDTAPALRTEIEEKFQRGELKGLGATIQAGGVGITLTAASHALFVDQAFTPALNAQAEDRICRIGQTRGCVITRLVADCKLDRAIHGLITRKQFLISASVDAAVGTAPDVEDAGVGWDALVSASEPGSDAQ